MKRMKKILTLGLAAVLTLGMSLTAWADEGADKKIGTADDRGSITVSGLLEEATENNKVEAVAYPIIQANYDETTDVFDGYKKLYAECEDLESTGWSSIEVDENGLITGSNGMFDEDVVMNVFAEADDRGTVNALAQWILGAENDTVIEGQKPNETNDNELVGVTKAGIKLNPVEKDGKIISFQNNNVPVGTYLVIIKNSEIKNYTPVIVSSYYTNNNGTGNEFANGALDIAAGKAWVKVTDKPSLGGKEVTAVTREESGKLNNVTGSANIGDTVSYKITVNSIPYYGGEHPKFRLVDELSKGLKYADPGVEVKVLGTKTDGSEDTVLTEGEDYVLRDESGQVLLSGNMGIKDKTAMIIDFVLGSSDEPNYTLNGYQGKNMVITYDVIVTSDAVVNKDPNTNDVTLEYSRNSHIDDDEGEDRRLTKTYTFDISGEIDGTGSALQKQDSTEKTALGGAEFTLYTDDNGKPGTVYKNEVMPEGTTTSYKVGDKIKDENGTEITLEEGNDKIGTFFIKGLAEGTYWLKETKAPEGYSLNEHAYKIEITAEYEPDRKVMIKEEINGEEVEVQATVDKTLTTWSVKIDDKDDALYTYNETDGGSTGDIYPIYNTKLINLPSTGGIGTTIFTVVGVLLMVGAASLFFVSRRKAQDGQEK